MRYVRDEFSFMFPTTADELEIRTFIQRKKSARWDELFINLRNSLLALSASGVTFFNEGWTSYLPNLIAERVKLAVKFFPTLDALRYVFSITSILLSLTLIILAYLIFRRDGFNIEIEEEELSVLRYENTDSVESINEEKISSLTLKQDTYDQYVLRVESMKSLLITSMFALFSIVTYIGLFLEVS